MNRNVKRGLGILIVAAFVVLIILQIPVNTKVGSYQTIDGQTGEVQTISSDDGK